MPRSSTGKWVSRAAATGGGRTYRGQRPLNWYAALVIIVVLGLVSVVWARYQYRHPQSASGVQPVVGSTLFAAYAVDICGKLEPALPPSTNQQVAGITTPGEGVLNVSPHVATQAGNNATVGQFFANYNGAALSTTQLVVPGHALHNGEKCAAGTPDAGQKGIVTGEAWTNSATQQGVRLDDPASHKIGSRSLITVGFVPKAAKNLLRPPDTAVNAMLSASLSVVNGTTTTTTAPTSTSTTAPSGTTTTAPTTTTTAPTGTTTTTK